MHVKQREHKQRLRCQCCNEYKDDRFCDWKTYGEEELVICSKCGHREAQTGERDNIKVYNPRTDLYTKTNMGKVNEHKSNIRVRKTESLF